MLDRCPAGPPPPPPHPRCPAYLAVQGPGNVFLPIDVGGLATVHPDCGERTSAGTVLLPLAVMSPALAAMIDFVPTWTLPLSDDLRSALLAGGVVHEALDPGIWQIHLAHLFLSAPMYQVHVLPGLR